MKIAVIGGGAAGLTAAIFAKRTCGTASVTVIDGNDRVGRKILSTGNGRCNLSNVDISSRNYVSRRPDFVERVLEGHGFDFVREFFSSIGVPLIIEDGRAYPRSMRAGAVVDALRYACLRLGVELITGCRVKEVESLRGRFLVDGEAFDKVILACGGKAAPTLGTDGAGYEFARALGHKVYSVYPALTQLRTTESDPSLKGIRAEARAIAVVHGEIIREEVGEVQFTDYGLSGIPVLQLSNVFSPDMAVSLDLLAELDFSAAVEELSSLADIGGELPMPELMGGYLHKNLVRRILADAGLDASTPAGRFTTREIKAFAKAAKNMRFSVAGTNSWPAAQTTRGGVDLSEIEPETMCSRLFGGLYFAGEIMDVCGDCGGYNLHWAWVSGAIAGKSAASRPRI